MCSQEKSRPKRNKPSQDLVYEPHCNSPNAILPVLIPSGCVSSSSILLLRFGLLLPSKGVSSDQPDDASLHQVKDDLAQKSGATSMRLREARSSIMKARWGGVASKRDASASHREVWAGQALAP